MADSDSLERFRRRALKMLSERGAKSRLADAIGIASGNLSDYLGGKREPSLPVIDKIARGLGVPTFELFMDDDSLAKWRSLTQPPRDDVLTSIGDLEERVRAIEEDRRQARKADIAAGMAVLEEIQEKKQKKGESG